MLVYDPQCDIVQWVPVWGTSVALTMMELCMANDLSNMVPLPQSKAGLVRPPSHKIIKGILAGAESDTNSSVIDSGDEWDKTEVGVWLHCPTLMVKIGPTWVEVHATTQEEEMIKKQDSTWEDIVSRQSSGGTEEEDWGMEEDSQSAVEPQFKDTTIEEEEEMEERVEQPVAGEPLAGEMGDATIDPRTQDVVQIHAGEDNL